MDPASDQLLARTGLAIDQDSGVESGNLGDQSGERIDGRGVADREPGSACLPVTPMARSIQGLNQVCVADGEWDLSAEPVVALR